MPDYKDRIAYTHWPLPTRGPVKKNIYHIPYKHLFLPTMEINSLKLEYFSHGLCLRETKDYPDPAFPLLLTTMEVKMTTIIQ